MKLLEFLDVEVAYGAIVALQGVSFHVEEGEIVTLLGANGAGKSTTLRTISGLLPLRRGEVRLGGADLRKLPAHRIVARGIAHVPEGRQVFPRMSVRDNLLMGAYTCHDRQQIGTSMAEVLEVFPMLKELLPRAGRTLSGGQQQMLAIARGLMARPRLLLLDEPSQGLAPIMVQTVTETLRRIRERGVTVLLVEQNISIPEAVAERVYVLESGRVALSGGREEFGGFESIKRIYLGGGAHAGVSRPA